MEKAKITHWGSDYNNIKKAEPVIPNSSSGMEPVWLPETNAVVAFMEKVNTEEARSGLKTLDRIADMIIFYTEACDNGEAMMKSWEA